MMGRPDAPAFLNRRDGSGIRRRKRGPDSVNNGALKKLLDERRNANKRTKAIEEDPSKKIEALQQEVSEVRAAHDRIHKRTAAQIGELLERCEALHRHNNKVREDVAKLGADLQGLERGFSAFVKKKNCGVETNSASRSLSTAWNEPDDARKQLERTRGFEKKPPPLQHCDGCGAVHLCTFRGWCDLDKNRVGVNLAVKCHNFFPKNAKPDLESHPGYEHQKGDGKLGALDWHPLNSQHVAWANSQGLLERKRAIWREAKKKQKSRNND